MAGVLVLESHPGDSQQATVRRARVHPCAQSCGALVGAQVMRREMGSLGWGHWTSRQPTPQNSPADTWGVS